MMRVILAALATASAAATAAGDDRLYELRAYTAAPGKLDAMESRAKEHGVKMLARHDITLVGAWKPIDNKDGKLFLLVSHKNADAHKSNWKAFIADPEWKAVVAETEKDGKLTAKVDVQLLTATDYSPDLAKLPAAKGERIFELRDYTASPGNLPALNARFRDHTLKLFERHGMTNVVYWNRAPGQLQADAKLVYLLAHPSPAAHKAAFDAFRKDPDWVAARAASEKAAGGSLTAAKDGVLSTLLRPTDFSPLK